MKDQSKFCACDFSVPTGGAVCSSQDCDSCHHFLYATRYALVVCAFIINYETQNIFLTFFKLTALAQISALCRKLTLTKIIHYNSDTAQLISAIFNSKLTFINIWR